MSFEENLLISVNNLSKCYEIYDNPRQRLKQKIFRNKINPYYKEFHALQNVTFDLVRGTSLGVIGKNGAGKSTLLQLITGTINPSQGEVKINGKVAAVLELGAGFNPEFTGRENIDLYCNVMQMHPNSIKDRFDKIVEFSELASFIDRPVKTYSSGMLARLAFSVIAHIDADILIIDEALSVGDAAFSQKCMRYLNDFRKKGSIFFVSHDLSAVKAFCDTAIWLDNGTVRAYGATKNVCDAYIASIYPNREAVSSTSKIKTNPVDKPQFAPKKQLHEIKKNNPTLEKQKLEAFVFDAESPSFGNKQAKITHVGLYDLELNPLAYCDGHTMVQVVISVEVFDEISSPILGFFIKDRLGQPLFGANTYLAYEASPVYVNEGDELEARFKFQMPILLVGQYSISAAIAAGTLHEHTQLHWMHDALQFQVTQSTMDGVLVGIPMQSIEMKCSQVTSDVAQ